ncbi:MAG: flavin reductase family protein [Candidatus Margulisbacteria bacterium]|nr:flavin reductase family protein [Candidatus Margulisiibacteriota bacterium]
MPKQKFPLADVYQLLGSGPTVLISTSLKGKYNVMPIAWTTPLDFKPPIIACCIGDHSYTFQIVKRTKEFVINIPTANLVKKVVGCGSVSGRKVDKFKKFKLTPEPASKIKAPLVKECYVNLECKVIDSSLINKYNLFIVKVVAAWMERGIKHPRTIHHITGKRFILGGREISA